MTQPAQQQNPAAGTPAAGSPAAPAAQQQGPAAAGGEQAEAPDWISRAGTILTVIALAGLGVVLLDVALKGRLLGPLLARLGAPQPDAEPAPAAPADDVPGPG